jgi:hypothetical protein
MNKNNLFQYLNGSDDEAIDDGFTSVKSSKKNRRRQEAPVNPPVIAESKAPDNWEDTTTTKAVVEEEWESAKPKRSVYVKAVTHNDDQETATSEIEQQLEQTSITTVDGASSSSSQPADLKLQSKWRYWTHETYTKDWMINSFYKLIVIGFISEFWRVFNNFDKIKGLEARYYFMMRGDIEPTWEHPKNRNGIIWSVQVPVSHISAVWERLCALIVGETLVAPELNPTNAKGEPNMLINGISTVLREVAANGKGSNGQKSTFYLIKIWLSRNENIVKNITAALKDISDLRDLSIRPMQLRPEY